MIVIDAGPPQRARNTRSSTRRDNCGASASAGGGWEGPLGERRILVIEDDPAIRLVLADILADEGYEVRVAADGAAGLHVLADWLPALILLDVTMPVLDAHGFRAAQRELAPPERDVPVLLLTGLSDPGQATTDLRALGAVRKPFDLDDLCARVQQALRPSVLPAQA